MDKAVVGLQFGDEGKGKVVSSLCSQAIHVPLVVRYCGGQQAGHRVVLDSGEAHIFSNFGSGTLQGFDTYWSKYCTVDPVGLMNELDILRKKLVEIGCKLYIDAKCPITTPYEKNENKRLEIEHHHGTCGVGVGQTYQREKDHYSLLIGDLFYPSIFDIKFKLMEKYYNKIQIGGIEDFLHSCNEITKASEISFTERIPSNGYSELIFEGSQGLLLDQNIGFFPHVTRGNTGTKNIIEMGYKPEIYLVTRAYQTRHGNGPMTNEDLDFRSDYRYWIPENPYEHNSNDGIQGEFRKTILDLDLLDYAINNDDYIKKNRHNVNLVITCMDILSRADFYSYTIGGKVYRYQTEVDFIKTICQYLRFDKCFVSRSPITEILECIK